MMGHAERGDPEYQEYHGPPAQQGLFRCGCGQLMTLTDQVSYLRHPCKKLLLTVRAVGSRRFVHQGASRQLLGSFSPVLLKIPNFLVEFVTPIARVSCCTLLL